MTEKNTSGGSDDAKRMAESNPLRFREVCGDSFVDSFVSTVRSGSGLQGLYSIATHSEQEKQDISGQVGGSFGPFSGSVSAQQHMERLESESRVGIHYFQMGGAGQPVVTDDKAFRTLVQSIGATATPQNATPFEIGLIQYRRLVNYPQADTPGRADLELMAQQYFRLDGLDVQINDILNNTSTDSAGFFFDEKITIEKLRNNQDQIKHDLKAIRDALSQCAVSPDSCTYPSDAMKTDYTFRSKIPIHNGNVSAWNALQSAKLKLENAKNTLRNTPQIVIHSFRNPIMVNPAYTQAKQNVDQATAAVDRAMSALDSTEERFLLWIDRPSRERCNNGEEDVCLDNAQLDEIRRSM
jgi:hypothetical protein